ncbi:MAG: histidine phosphatase family protein [Steroidobacteraceae bacterium]|jgi:phosphohistidine phosphatase
MGETTVVARRLTLLRHGEAQALDSCPEDFERTLTRRGEIEAQEIAERIVRRNLIPDLILVSPAERAWSTAEIVASACELDTKQLQCARELYLATPETTWKLLARRDSALRHILICGHNPGLSQVASRLGPIPTRRNLTTAGLATAVWLNAQWDALQPETAASCELDDPESMLD